MNKLVRGIVAISTLAFLQGCGTYNAVTYMIPKTGNGWTNQKSPIGLSIENHYKFECNDSSVGLEAPLLYSRKVAQAVLWIPFPYSDEQAPHPNLNDPVRLVTSFRSQLISACENSMGLVTSPKLKEGINLQVSKKRGPRGLQEVHNPAYAFHMCVFEIPPIAETGDQFRIKFRKELLGCEIPPLDFERKDSTEYMPSSMSF